MPNITRHDFGQYLAREAFSYHRRGAGLAPDHWRKRERMGGWASDYPHGTRV